MNLNIRDTFLSAREDVFAARKSENINDPIDTYIVDYVAMGWSRLFIKLHIVPNAVTLLSMISGVAGGLFLFRTQLGYTLIGILLVFLSAVFDASDGQVARLTHHYSRLGRMLDGLSDGTVYFTLYLAAIVRLYPKHYLPNDLTWTLLLGLLLIAVYCLYVVQCQLPDYFKNVHMYMIDNAHGNELSRSKHVKDELDRAKRGSFEQVSTWIYYHYTLAQEHRAPRTQKMLDAVERYGKSEQVMDAFYEQSHTLVKLTNLMTFNLRTIVLLISMLFHVELVGLLFVILVLEPIRWILLQRYENLSRELLSKIN